MAGRNKNRIVQFSRWWRRTCCDCWWPYESDDDVAKHSVVDAVDSCAALGVPTRYLFDMSVSPLLFLGGGVCFVSFWKLGLHFWVWHFNDTAISSTWNGIFHVKYTQLKWVHGGKKKPQLVFVIVTVHVCSLKLSSMFLVCQTTLSSKMWLFWKIFELKTSLFILSMT